MDVRSPAERASPSRERPACFHCGEPCPNNEVASGGRVFCCQGCRFVHDLLTESGLAHFYELNETPGVRVSGARARDRFAYLDDPALQHRWLNFTDGKQSRVTFYVPTIHCIACVWLLENLFRLHPGIEHSQVDFGKREVTIAFSTEKIRLSELVALLTSIGYEPSLTLSELEGRQADPARKRRWLQIGVAGFAFGNIMLLSIPQYLGLDALSDGDFKAFFRWLSLGLALPVVIFSASDYWKSALLSLRQRTLTLDVPIALGLAAIYGRSLVEIVAGTGGGYCDSLTGLIFFLLCGRAFQQKTFEQLSFDRDYKSFFPLAVTRKQRGKTDLPLDHDARQRICIFSEERISLPQLRVGDCIILRNRELIPTDSKLVSGPAFIDYSFVTGESEPVEKREGDYLYAGGQQIGAAIEVETVKPVSQSYLASLWDHDAFRKDGSDDFRALINRFSRYFTLIVISAALGSVVYWVASNDLPRGLKAFTSVLIVACPCALALATPFTLGTAQRWLARINVFLKNALVLERLGQVDAIVFDKTGTLTLAGAGAVKFEGTDLSDAERRWIFSLTRHSTHPHSVRISESFGGEPFPEPVRSFLETPGSGIEGQVEGREIWLGSREWLESRQVTAETTSASTEGNIVHVAIDGRYRGAFVLSSDVRPQIHRIIRQLEERYELALLSGDNEREQERFRALFGKKARLNFNQSPLDKLGFIRRLQDSGKTVMMVGDGLNDAGALKQSDIGVAVVEKIGSFSPASDVILDAARVPQIPEILTLARRATSIVRVSLGISGAYNVVGVSIAAAGLLSPLVCAVLMPLSSVSVALFACGVTTWAAHHICLTKETTATP